MPALLDILARWRPCRVLVVGDLMLDQLVYGDAERLTADAPVPVLHVRRTDQRPGGASNVCLNLVALGAAVSIVGLVGDDAEGHTLRNKLQAAGVDCAALLTHPDRPTTVKRNLIGLAQHRHPQKMFRLDVEDDSELDDQTLDRLRAAAADLIAHADVVAIEDYDKGVCTEALCRSVIDAAHAAGKPVIVDPAARADFSRYARCTAITPNRSEAEKATGLRAGSPEQVDQLAQTLRDALDCDALVLTLDRDGALLLQRDHQPNRIPTVARDVYDVTGAGDMVLAALAAAVANAMDWTDAVRFANAAAGLEVQVFGVQPMPFERVYHAVLKDAGVLLGKRRTPEQALIEVAAAKREGKNVVFTNGCFDIVHAGHIAMLRAARKLGDFLVLGVNSDDSVRRLKGPERPVHNQDDRVEVLSELESVDLVVVFDEDTPINLIEKLAPDVLAKGADYTADQVVGREIVEARGGRVELIPLLEGRSTTGVIQRVRGA